MLDSATVASTEPAAATAPAGSRIPRAEPAAIFICMLLSLVWGWWAWQDGAYFGVVLLPGAIVLCAAAALLAGFAPWRADLRLSPPVVVALAGLTALGAWTLLSTFWSPAPDVAVADGQRVLIYALCFGLGLWLCNLLGPRMHVALLPLAAAGALAGLATVIALIGADSPRDLLETDGTLDYPLGYRNANAAFFSVALFPAVGLAAASALDWRLRGVALGAATLCIDLVLLCQSRASAPAMLVAVAVFVLLSPARLRALSWLLLACLPALGVIAPAAALYSAAGDGGVATAAPELTDAGIAVALTSVVAVALGAAAARFEPRLPGLGSDGPRGNRGVAWGFAVAAAIGAVAFVVAVGNPIDWAGDRLDEFRGGGTPDLSEQSSRFGFNAASNRKDLWQVALDEAAEAPVLGTGAGGYEYAYTLERQVGYQDARDAHSVELELLSELGLPGLVLFVVAIVGAAVGVVRARRLGPAAAALAAVALASGSYWLIHTSVDWFWPYPAVTAPVLALLGAACAPAVFAITRRRSRAWRALLVAGLAVLAISAIPPYLSERYVNDAYAGWRADINRAFDDLARAGDLNPLSDAPLLAEGAIAREAGDTARALDAFTAAAEKRPEEWAAHYLLADLQRDSNPVEARDEIRTALELNPLSTRVHALARSLDVEPAPPAG